MSILAIDTATQVSSVAVASVDKLAAELTMQAKLTHSETLMPHIKEVLRMANVRKEQLEGIAVSIGPGSFTGLRIGLAAAKAMRSTCPSSASRRSRRSPITIPSRASAS